MAKYWYYVNDEGKLLLYRKSEDGAETYIKIKPKFSARISEIQNLYGDDEEKMQDKLQTFYIYLMAMGCIPQSVGT